MHFDKNLVPWATIQSMKWNNQTCNVRQRYTYDIKVSNSIYNMLNDMLFVDKCLNFPQTFPRIVLPETIYLNQHQILMSLNKH